jgi:hypothetical protein
MTVKNKKCSIKFPKNDLDHPAGQVLPAHDLGVSFSNLLTTSTQ